MADNAVLNASSPYVNEGGKAGYKEGHEGYNYQNNGRSTRNGLSGVRA